MKSFKGSSNKLVAARFQWQADVGTLCLHQNLEKESHELESSQDHVIKESIACRSEPTDSNIAMESAFFR